MQRTLIIAGLFIVSSMAAQTTDSMCIDTAQDLKMKEVEVLAQRRKGTSTTSYRLNRLALDHHQMLNMADIATLLPGGKTVTPTLINDMRIGLRANPMERGNATFGTAIEVDGMRMDNNGMMDETAGASTRSIGTSSIESVEIITGIPSVEYGDISNGVVKVETRRGSSPFIFEAGTNPYTKQVALNKGFAMHKKRADLGTLNCSFEHAQSFTSTTSPHTSYQRNALSLHYLKTLVVGTSAFTIKANMSGSIGGYNSKADPDAFAHTYQKVHDNQLHTGLTLAWYKSAAPSDGREGPSWKTEVSAAFSTSDRMTENYTNKSSSSAQPMLHAMQNGYFIAEATDCDNEALPPVMLGPTGYWYERSFHDQKPQSWQVKAKSSMTLKRSHLLLGTEYKASRNNGRGLYYEDPSLAPTWRPYRYDQLPTMTYLSVFAEDRLTIGHLQVTAGVREDIMPKTTLSPRATVKYDIRTGKQCLISIHSGYGKSVKLPSFQILHPADKYLDRLAFTPGSTADNKAFYAYNTYVSKGEHNPDLKWQYTNQFDIGTEVEWHGARLSASLFLHKTLHPYQQVNQYEPVLYRYTSQDALEGIHIPSADRLYSIDRESGVVSVQSASSGECMTLPSTTYYTYNYYSRFVNGSPVTRYGVEWILDSPKLHLGSKTDAGSITLRLDGNYYHYQGLDRTLFAGVPNGVKDATDGNTLIGYYLGSNAISASTTATPSVSSGTLSKQCNLNTTVTLHIPRIRFIATLRFETSLLSYKRQLSNATESTCGYPLYYSTWDNPERLIPFAEAYEQSIAYGDTQLSSSLRQLIKSTPTDYYFRPQRLSPYYCINLSLTKEIGSWLSISFYANNFLNSMQKVRDSQTQLSQSLFNSGLITKFYYGLSVRVKI